MTLQIAHRDGFDPLRITARMAGEIVYLGDLLHLDGPIAAAVFADLDDRTRATIPPIEATDWPIDLELPLSTWWVDYDPGAHGEIDARLLKRRKTGVSSTAPQLWGWCCSAADDETWRHRGKRAVRKKPDLARMGRYTDAGSAHLSSGHMKAYDLAFPTVLADRVVWHAHGDGDRIKALLQRHVPAIGKKRNIGGGRVIEWIVEPDDCDRSVVDDGRLMRRLPFGAADGSPRMGAIRPPYYHSTRAVMAVEP